VGEQQRVHALLQARAVTHQMQPPACPFALGTHLRVGQPDRRHQVAAGELGEDPGVDPVGLAGQRCEPFHLLRVGDLDLPARKLEPIVHNAARRSSTRSRHGSARHDGRAVASACAGHRHPAGRHRLRPFHRQRRAGESRDACD